MIKITNQISNAKIFHNLHSSCMLNQKKTSNVTHKIKIFSYDDILTIYHYKKNHTPPKPRNLYTDDKRH